MYALVDCHNFYCSCERVFNPSLEGRPVIVLSNNDGCAISRSEEAKQIGIAMAAPAFMMRDLIDKYNVAVFSSNYTLYGDMSNRILETLRDFAPRIESYSIDEAFLDLRAVDPAMLYAHGVRIRETIAKNIGIPVSVGIAQTKTLAKMANRYAKKINPGQSVFFAGSREALEEMLNATPVEAVWGIGGQHAILLTRSGFRTAADLRDAPENWIRKHLSVVGLRLLYELRGIPSIPWEDAPSPRKNICTSRSFGTRLTDKATIGEALANHAAACAAKLRADGTCCGRLKVFIQTNPHKTEETQYLRSVEVVLDRASNDTGTLIKNATRGLDLIFTRGFRYMKTGVTAMDIVPQTQIQSTCFDGEGHRKKGKLMETVDRINGSLGRDTLRSAVQGFERSYKLKAEYLSHRYTTRWDEVLQIRI